MWLPHLLLSVFPQAPASDGGGEGGEVCEAGEAEVVHRRGGKGMVGDSPESHKVEVCTTAEA